MMTRLLTALFFLSVILPLKGFSSGYGPLLKPVKPEVPSPKITKILPPVVRPKDPKITDKTDKIDLRLLKKGGGWGSSGGGSGVACFANSAVAEQAQGYIADGRPLPLDLKNQIQQLETLDYWEWRQTKPFELFQPKSQDYQEIIKEVYQHAGMAAPIFVYRLQQTSQIVELSDWNGKTALPKIDDAKPAHSLPENCRLVQLAARYTKEKYEMGVGPTVHRPVVKIDFDRDLFAKLSPLDQAILVVHEQMYLMGQTTGHNNSNAIRPFVMRLFEKELDHRSLRWNLVTTFGDYLIYFGEDFKIKAEDGTPESRFNSFYDMVRRIRRATGSCAERNGLPTSPKTASTQKAYRLCLDEAMNPYENQKWLTDEMSFIYISYYFFDNTMGFFNSEVLLVPSSDPQFKQLAQRHLQATCHLMAIEKYKFSAAEMAEKAQRYCQSLKL